MEPYQHIIIRNISNVETNFYFCAMHVILTRMFIYTLEHISLNCMHCRTKSTKENRTRKRKKTWWNCVKSQLVKEKWPFVFWCVFQFLERIFIIEIHCFTYNSYAVQICIQFIQGICVCVLACVCVCVQ